MPFNLTRAVAAAVALLCWAALILQLSLTVGLVSSQGGSLLDGLWRYFGYFTIIANLFAAISLTLAALGRGNARRELAMVSAMILVGVTYSLLLRNVWDPQGAQKVADVLLHDAMPVLTVLVWLVRPHRMLGWVDTGYALLLPVGYTAYAMTRAVADGWYPYPLMDVAQFGAAQVALNCTVMGMAFLVLALLLVWLDRKLP
jgi:hypothetical protein